MKRSPALVLISLVVLACGTDDEGSVPVAAAPDAADATTTIPTSDAGVVLPSGDANVLDAPLDVKADTTPATTYSGEATYYDAHGPNACGLSMAGSDYLVAAMNQSQYKKSLCGLCAHVKGPKGEVTVKVVDLCPGCDYGDLDLSEEAFVQISPLSAGRVKITWGYVPCP